MAMYWLGKQKDNEDRQAFAELLDTKPMLEFEFTDGKLSAIKIGLGVGKRKKFDYSTPDTSAPAQNPNAPNNPAASPAAPPDPNAAAAAPAAASPPATGPPNQQDSQTSVSVLGGGPASPPSAATNDAVKSDTSSAGAGNP
jgi:hypothetical protein